MILLPTTGLKTVGIAIPSDSSNIPCAKLQSSLVMQKTSENNKQAQKHKLNAGGAKDKRITSLQLVK